jgi:hypothetical protein
MFKLWTLMIHSNSDCRLSAVIQNWRCGFGYAGELGAIISGSREFSNEEAPQAPTKITKQLFIYF